MLFCFIASLKKKIFCLLSQSFLHLFIFICLALIYLIVERNDEAQRNEENINNNDDFQQRNEFASRLRKKRKLQNYGSFDFNKMMEILEKDEDKDKSKFILGVNL